MKVAVIVCVSVLGAGGAVCGQITSNLIRVNPLGRSQNGWQFYSATASFGYSTAAAANSVLPAFTLERLQGDYDGTASASLGFNQQGERTQFAFFYSPSYVRRIRLSEIKAFNQSLSLQFSRQVTPKWNLSISGQGTDATLDQLLFAPAVLSAATTPVATLDDLLMATQSGLYGADQVASLLTGTPYVETPSRSIVYGTSYLSLGVNANLTYQASARLSVNVGGGATRSQTRTGENRTDLTGLSNYLIPSNTTQRFNASVMYGLSPRTELTMSVNTERVDSSFGLYYTSNAMVGFNRKMSARWFVGAGAGAGYFAPEKIRVEPSALAPPMSARPGPIVQLNTGYTMAAQSWMASYSRAVSDSLGFISQTSENISASWQWQRPGSRWGLNGSGGLQRLFDSSIGDVRYWHANGSVSRSLNRQFRMMFTIAYVQRPSDGIRGGIDSRNLSGYSARIALTWTPQGQHLQ